MKFFIGYSLNVQFLQINNFKMSFTNEEQIDCPICFDQIREKNNINTECGHKFHASCLMTNISRNGFNCPCCRFVMAEEIDEDDETLIEDQSDSDDSEEEEELYTDDALRGLRLFSNRLEGEENTQEDIVAEYEYPEEEEPIDNAAPPSHYVATMLEREHVSYGDLTSAILADHDGYVNAGTFDRIADRIWNITRRIIDNYMRDGPSPDFVEQEQQEEEEPREVEEEDEEDNDGEWVESNKFPGGCLHGEDARWVPYSHPYFTRVASQEALSVVSQVSEEPLEEGECVRDPCVPNGWKLPLTLNERMDELDEIRLDLNKYFAKFPMIST
jgi:hypothetical protein